MPENLLFLSHRIPYPPNKGDKIRSFHLLEHLNRRYRVHLGTFIDDEKDWQYEDKVRAMCGECCILEMNPGLSKLRSLSGLLSGKALSLPYYRHGPLQQWVDRIVGDLSIEKIVVFSSAMAQYAEKHEHALRIMDFVDVDSDKWMQYAKAKTWPLDLIYRREGRLLERYERKIAETFDASFFVSRKEAGMFKALAPESASRIHAYCNGVDAEYFSPERHYPDPFASNEKVIVFTGAMDYWPNIDAVTWFSEEIFPMISRENGEARFYIVGSNPSGAVLRLAATPGIVVTGRVDDVRPYLAHALLAVAPLRIARGIQNKVLEAMAMAKPVVASPQALEGIEAEGSCLLACDAGGFAKHVLDVLARRCANPAGRASILENYDWGRNLAALSDRLEGKTS